MKKLLAFTILAFMLVGCQDNSPSFEYYMQHPEKVPGKLEACRNMADSQVSNDQSCIAAIKARRAIGGLLAELQASPQEYGAKIMQLQIQYANIKEQIDKANKQDSKQLAELQKQAADLKYHINVYQGVIRLVGG